MFFWASSTFMFVAEWKLQWICDQILYWGCLYSANHHRSSIARHSLKGTEAFLAVQGVARPCEVEGVQLSVFVHVSDTCIGLLVPYLLNAAKSISKFKEMYNFP